MSDETPKELTARLMRLLVDEVQNVACGWAFFAGVLEAERDRAQRHIDAAGDGMNLLALLDGYFDDKLKAERERDEARAEVAKVWREIDCGSDSDECSIDGPLPCRRHAIEELAENRDETIAAIAELDEARARIEKLEEGLDDARRVAKRLAEGWSYGARTQSERDRFDEFIITAIAYEVEP